MHRYTKSRKLAVNELGKVHSSLLFEMRARRGTGTRLAIWACFSLDWERDLTLHLGARSEMATRYVPGATSIEIPLRDTDEVQ